MKLRYRQQGDGPDAWCEVSDDDDGPVIAVEIELEEGERLYAPSVTLLERGETYTVELARSLYRGRRSERPE